MKCSNYMRNLLYKIVRMFWCQINLTQERGLFDKWSTLDPKNFYAIPFPKLVFFISFYPEFLEKKNKEIKKKYQQLIFWSFIAVFVSSSMLILCWAEKKKKLTFLFITPLILFINMSISLFR